MDIKQMFSDYVLDTYTRVGPVFVRGRGSYLWDDKGKKYLDFFPGWGVDILGHSYPRISEVLAKQSKQLIHIPNNLYNPYQALLAREIVKNSFRGKVFFANSGTEAVEGVLKLARVYGRNCKGCRAEIICMEDSFHGRTMGALSLTAQAKYQRPFKPLLSGIKTAKFGDFKSFKDKVTTKTAAVILEPIQGEGGVNLASRDYFKQLREFCTKNKILLIFDEVQTGMGRTTKMFCFQNYGINPDAFTLSKGLGAGFPISAFIVSEKFASLFKPGMHASTFGGSPLATRVSLEVFKIFKEENILDEVKKRSKILEKRLKNLQNKFWFVKDVRGKGLMQAVELSFESMPLFTAALEKGLIINSTHSTILRIMPALNISREDLDKGLDIFEEILAEVKEKKNK
jgi:acetylornithine/N-succinyldiaminopimelate aminotransferase